MLEANAESGASLGVYVDVNPGMDRTGVALGPAALRAATDVRRVARDALVGLHMYDGHAASVGAGCGGTFSPLLSAAMAAKKGTLIRRNAAVV